MSDAGEPGRVLITREEIQSRVAELGARITEDYRHKNPLLIAVLRGAAMFHSDLIRHIDLKLQVDFISVSSYGAETETSGEVQLVKDLETSIRDKDVILVEDIIDTGLTADYLLRNLKSRQPASLRVCSFLSKPSRREVDVTIHYLGFEVPDEFVVGYGLDFDQKFRNLPHIAALDGERSAEA